MTIEIRIEPEAARALLQQLAPFVPFRDWCPNAAIYGADIDQAALFEETRIRTFFADKTAPASLADLGRYIAKELDLIIDDELHANANVATLTFELSRIRRGGWT